MPINKADTKHITEGRYEDVTQQRLIYGDSASHATKPSFVRMVVLDVISDPLAVDRTKLDYYEHELGVSNASYAAAAPRNSIIARPVMRGGAGAHERVMVLFPFFPPHLAMPAKPGEHVWAVFENPNAPVSEVGYWMCRVVGPHFVEDVNYTHADRQGDRSFLPGISDSFSGDIDPVYEFRNGVVDARDGARYTIGGTASLPGDETAYEGLLRDSDAGRITAYEPVPRYRKRPADLALEGSNNTLVVLGTDRTGQASAYDGDPERGPVPRRPDDVFDVGAGSIDIVVGRGQAPTTAGKAVDNRTLAGSPMGKELAKARPDLTPGEGDPDLVHDRSRVLVSQKTRPDVNFRINNVVQQHAASDPVDDGSGEGAIVVKTDKVRLIARRDVVIMVTGATELDAAGNVKDPGTLDPSKCASVIIRTNGDIVFTPARRGVIKLGGDDASLAVLCGKALSGAGDGTGQVTAAPLVDNMGGQEGMGGPTGEFATKVLLK